MKRRSWEAGIVIAGSALLLALAFLAQREQQPARISTFSTYDDGPNGYRVLYDVLRGARVPVRRYEGQLSLLDPAVRTLVVSTVTPELAARDPRAQPLSDRDAAVLENFVRGGGRLVMLGSGATDFAAAPGLETGVVSLARAGSARALAHVALTSGVTRVDGTIVTGFPFATRNAVPLLATPSGLVAIEYPLGKGDVIAIAAPDLFSDRNLARADDARFAYDAIATHGPAAFDERVHGYVQDESLWAALPPPVHAGVFIALGVLLLSLIGANVRFAPPVAAERPDERDSSAYLTAMAALLRRAHAARSAIAAFAQDAARRTRARGTLSPAAGEEFTALERLHALHRPGDAALTRAARASARLRKELSFHARQ